MEWKKNWLKSWLRRTALLISAVTACGGCVPIQNNPGVHEHSQALRLIDQGTAFLRVGDLDQAEASFQVAREIIPMAAALDGLGCVAFLRGQPLTAERYFIEAYEADPSYLQSIGNLALLYESQGLSTKAQGVYEMAIRGDPQNFRARNNFAGFLISTKADAQNRRRAREELLRAQAIVAHPLIDDNIKRHAQP